MDDLQLDRIRYGEEKIPRFQVYLRKTQRCTFKPLKLLYKALFVHYRRKNCCEIYDSSRIGPGVYFGHPYGIVINPGAVIGSNVNIHKGATIGQENRGKRKGAPTIGNDVWIGVNATVVGGIRIGNDVLIAPNAYVNFDVPDHSIVLGNPGTIIRRNDATEGYINNRVPLDL